MPIGFELYTPEGKLQASSSMMNYHLRATVQKQTQTRNGGNTTPSSLLVQKTGATTNALCAVYGINGETASLLGISHIDGVAYWNFATNAAVGAWFNCYIYDRAISIPPSNIGLEIRNTANEITFSSNYRPMAALTIISSGSVHYPGKTLASFNLAWAGFRYNENIRYYGGGELRIPDVDYSNVDSKSYTNNGQLYGGRCQDSGQTCVVDLVAWDYVESHGHGVYDELPHEYNIPIKLFVIDVTGIPTGNATYF